AQLLQFAEEVKMSLSEPRGKSGVQVRNQHILVDDSGSKVQILESINREQFIALIKDDLEKTLECTERALERAAAKMEGGVCNPDHYLLVGGSTYGPWVSDAVSARFKVEATPFNPDTCVAIGAALVAATLSADASGGGLNLAVDVPSSTPLPMVNISGTVLTENNEPVPEAERQGLRVRLHSPEGPETVPLEVNGSFLFADRPLQESGPTDFRVEVLDAQGVSRIARAFAVTYAPDTVTGEIYASVPKSIFVRTKDGLKLVALEGETLPAKCEIKRPKLHKDDSFDIPVIQDGEQVATIGVSGIPESAGEGSMIAVSVEVTQQNKMQGNLTVTNAKGAVVAQSHIAISFPPLRIPELPELRDLFEELNAEREQEAFNTPDPDRRATLDGKGCKIARKIEKLMSEGMGQDRQEIYRELVEYRKVVQPPPEDMDPPRQEFRELVEECHDLLSRHSSNPEVQPLADALKKIEARAEDAYKTKNHKTWAAENGNLVTLYQRLSKLGGDGGERELPPTPILKDGCAQEIDQLRARLHSQRNALESLPRYATHIKSRLDAIEHEIGLMAAALAKIDDELPPKQGLPQCKLVLRPSADLEKRIKEAADVW
ncbi:MAG TPA: Hsp70 family protein, partial [Chthoniobacteraceae bacterium]|nr:Hsp70 family protein [Chthoniobacteraceae bacterium]